MESLWGPNWRKEPGTAAAQKKALGALEAQVNSAAAEALLAQMGSAVAAGQGQEEQPVCHWEVYNVRHLAAF